MEESSCSRASKNQGRKEIAFDECDDYIIATSRWCQIVKIWSSYKFLRALDIIEIEHMMQIDNNENNENGNVDRRILPKKFKPLPLHF